MFGGWSYSRNGKMPVIRNYFIFINVKYIAGSFKKK